MAPDFLDTRIKNLAIHRIGNRLQDEGYFLSKRVTDIHDDDAHALLLNFFTHQFKAPEFYQFTHPTNTANNDVFKLVQQIFTRKIDFLDFSQDLAKLLYSQSNHPKIHSGELYVTLFSDVALNGEMISAVGIFKSESKTPFMKVLHKTDIYDYEFDEGINLNAIDKACIVMNAEGEDGYRVLLHDRQGKGEEAIYWKDEFLGLKPCADDYHKTRQFMSMAKDYIKDRLPQEFEVEKTDQIDMLNKSVAFFKQNEQFDYKSFTREVIQEPHLMKSFGRFKDEYEEKNSIPLGVEFEINPMAVKNQSRVFKSVLKLDKNFHIYVHGSKDMIEKGFDDERGLNYYKVFFREEH
jgi:hypothetical protein